MLSTEAAPASAGRSKDEKPTVLLPPWVVAVGPPQAWEGPLQLARVTRIERGVGHVRTLCDLPVQPHWHSQEIGTRSVCRGCLAALEQSRSTG